MSVVAENADSDRNSISVGSTTTTVNFKFVWKYHSFNIFTSIFLVEVTSSSSVHTVKFLMCMSLLEDLPPWLSGLAISGRGAVKAWLAIRQGVGLYPIPAGMSSQVSA